MGGNIFSHTSRITSEVFEYVSNQICDIVAPFVSTARPIVSYTTKSSHGDIDILMSIPSIPNNLNETICKISNVIFSTDFVEHSTRNGDVFSLAWRYGNQKYVQVDLIFVEDSYADFAYGYFSYNDMGNFIGKYAHKMGLKFGHKGLLLPVRNNNQHLLGEIVITRNIEEAIEFLGFDLDFYRNKIANGFNTMDEVFQFVTNNPRFNKEMFSYESMNHIARVRDRKRANYNALLWYVKELPDTDFVWNPDKSYYLKEIFHKFPNSKLELDRLMGEDLRRSNINKKWNGNIVKDVTGLENKQLGAFLKQHRPSDDFILTSTENEIKDYIIKRYKNV